MKSRTIQTVRKFSISTLLAGTALVAGTSPASAAALPVTSYDMINGGTSSPGYSLRDDTYSGGTGNPASNYSTLSGGKGDLTDGVIATSNWNITTAPFVGWSQSYVASPVITFHFARVMDISDVSVHMNWGYSASSADFSVDRTTWVHRVIDLPASPGGANFWAGFQDLGLTGDTLVMRLNDRAGFFYNSNYLAADWILISEVTIDGVPAPIPEPAVTSLLLAGMGIVSIAARGRTRRNRKIPG